ncbi:MAG: hypothetical protein PVG79_16920 [Gemmatimonadales bacterium]|jgi:hypothetical protein
MRQTAHLLAPIVLGVLAAACSSSSVPEMSTTYDKDLGRASHQQIDETVVRILNRYAFEVERIEDQTSSYYLLTRWKWREPLDDEQALGYAEASTRITVEARAITSARGDPMGVVQSPAVWRVRLRAENRLRRPMSAEWEEPELTDEFRQYMDQIANDITTEFKSRFR